jgi:hypothetical protein
MTTPTLALRGTRALPALGLHAARMVASAGCAPTLADKNATLLRQQPGTQDCSAGAREFKIEALLLALTSLVRHSLHQ